MTTRLLNRMLSSLMGLPNPAWVSLGNVVSHMGPFTFDSQFESQRRFSTVEETLWSKLNGLRLGSIKAPRKRSLAVSTFLAVASSSRGEIARADGQVAFAPVESLISM